MTSLDNTFRKEQQDAYVSPQTAELSSRFFHKGVSETNYIKQAYYKNGKPCVNKKEYHIDGKIITRVGIGEYSYEKVIDDLAKEEFEQVDFVEKVYFFIDNKLFKYSEYKCFTSYNVLPSNYWISVLSVDRYFKNDKLVKTSCFSGGTLGNDREEIKGAHAQSISKLLPYTENIVTNSYLLLNAE